MLGRGTSLSKGPEVGPVQMVYREWGGEELDVAGEQTWQRGYWAGQGGATDAQLRRPDLFQEF